MKRCREACEYVGVRWREFCFSATVKLHALEDHLPAYLKLFGRLRIFGEDGTERAHHVINKWNRVYGNIRNWQSKCTVRERSIRSSELSSVSEVVAAVYSDTKRNFSDQSIDRKNTKRMISGQVKKEQFDKVNIPVDVWLSELNELNEEILVPAENA